MLQKYGISALAVVLAITFSAFTSAPKKTSSNQASTLYYWYQMDLQTNSIPQGANYFAHTTEAAVESPCPENLQEVDCIRGFSDPLNTSGGPVYIEGEVRKQTAALNNR